MGTIGKTALALCLSAVSYNTYTNLVYTDVNVPIQMEAAVMPEEVAIEIEYADIETELDKSIHCMASNIYFESKNQPEVDMYAVGHVVLNRLSNADFPRRIDGKIATKEQRMNNDSICNIVYDAKLDAKGNQVKYQCQFSWYCDGKPEVIVSKEKWAQAELVAIRLLTSDMYDFTGGALYYHADYVSPEWAKSHTKTLQVKNHIYYR